MNQFISIKGARQHNLKNINLTLPKNQLVVFTGLSGSGKSSLAFDTIYAEGQRRYVESLSSYARQFLGVMNKPDVDTIEGLSPAISIDQKSVSHNPRSTVGTITEIYDYMRLLFARIGHPHCPNCGREIASQSAQQIVDAALDYGQKELADRVRKTLRLMVLAPVVRGRKGEFSHLLGQIKARGYSKVRIDRQMFNFSDDIVLIKTNTHTIEVVVDRLVVSSDQLKDEIARTNLRSRLQDSIEQSLSLSDGLVIIAKVLDKGFSMPDKPANVEDHLYSERFSCPVCSISLPEIEPRTFSFNSPYGACPVCTGIGTLKEVDQALVLNLNLSITEGAILPFASMFMYDTWYSRLVKKVCDEIGINIRAPLALASAEQRQLLLEGSGDKLYHVEGTNRDGRWTSIEEQFPGIIAELKKRFEETDSDYIRAEIGKYMREETCPGCNGTRLKKETLGITVNGKSIADATNFSISDASGWIKTLAPSLSNREKVIAEPIFKEISARLGFLISVGLDYLTLNRTAATLSGGEAQRIRLASQIGSGLTGVVYVLDEPSIGLHQRDNKRLIDTLKKLRDLGNSVIVVEHDREMMENADLIVDFGPRAGQEGGRIVAVGTPDEIKRNPNSLTGQYLSGKKTINLASYSPAKHSNSQQLIIKGCSQFNLKNIDVAIPLSKFICVAGVSGSGKSTLVVETLYHALMSHVNPFHSLKPGKYRLLLGQEAIDKVILIDQSAIGKTPRSNPATYSGAFTIIRDLFAQTPEARSRGYRAGRFSFNVKGGRCEVCQGEGQIKIEMQFLPDIYVDCEVCAGTRYNRETLEVHFKSQTIAQVLDMTVASALDLFQPIPGLFDKLQTLSEVGLAYVKLGQPAPTLSGGEAQRVKLATELAKRATGKTLYILDEPTTGLHFADLEKLIHVLKRLVGRGNTVIVIEHNLDLIKNADWIIDLGPGGGDAGGRIVAQGSPDTVSRVQSSYTGHFLQTVL